MRYLRLINILFILSLFALNAQAQGNDGIKFADILFPTSSQIVNPKFKPLTKEEILSLDGNIELHSESLQGYFNNVRKKDDHFDYYLSFLSEFNKFDLGEGKEGLIFSSYFGSEEMRHLIWLKQGSRYIYSGELAGQIIKIFRSTNKQPFTIVTRSGWCCASGIGAFNIYTPKDDSGVISYHLAQSVQEHGSVQMPETRMEPIKFQILEKRCRLRESPVIDDKYYWNEFENSKVHGNILEEFKNGDKGIAIAESVDNTGNKWWFVLMEPIAAKTYERFYNDTKSKSQFTMGWMNSRYLEVIK